MWAIGTARPSGSLGGDASPVGGALKWTGRFEARFGAPDASIRECIEVASTEQIMDWIEALLQVATPEDLFD